MQPQRFLEKVISEQLRASGDISETVFVLPSRRACFFLKRELSAQMGKTLFAPEVYSIEEFVAHLSGLQKASHTTLLFELYEAYAETVPDGQAESLEHFAGWGPTLLTDFNEVDAHLVPAAELFSYLERVKELSHWSVSEPKTGMIEDYLTFWKTLPECYERFRQRLLGQGIAYAGLLYREAADHVEHYLQAVSGKRHVFAGFNALNAAETQILQELLEAGNTEVYWDADRFFMDKSQHGASRFMRQYKNSWKYYENHPFLSIEDNYATAKQVENIAVSKNVGQAKQVGKILESLPQEALENTVVVLADENLLEPLLQSLPSNIEACNITMGVSLQSLPACRFFVKWVQLQARSGKTYYHRDVLELLEHPVAGRLPGRAARKTAQALVKSNRAYVSPKEIAHFSGGLDILFAPWRDVAHAQDSTLQLIETLFPKDKEPVLQETLFRLHELVTQLGRLQSRYNRLHSLPEWARFFSELIAQETLDFRGEPYSGLQIMGVLETRALDFENILITSVNEGVLPGGKNANTFIPYDLKRSYNLPAHNERDAIFTYHFYRLLHRAKKVHLLYNNHTEGLNAGEKSRFLWQMQQDGLKEHNLHECVAHPTLSLGKKTLKRVEKTAGVLQEIEALFQSGVSPSALTTYIRNPIDFYYKYILKVKEMEQLEETVEANTLGTIIHDSLEALYTPFLNSLLTSENIDAMRKRVPEVIARNFDKTYAGGDLSQGKNRIIYEVAQGYVRNFLNYEQEAVEKNEVVVQAVERKLTTSLDVPGILFPVVLRGTVDRIDLVDGHTRIADYKTGRVEKRDLAPTDWETLRSDFKYSKAFQVLHYALLFAHNHPPGAAAPFEAGVWSFKKLKDGFLPFTFDGKTEIDTHILQVFSEALKQLLLEIYDKEMPFEEKTIAVPAYR